MVLESVVADLLNRFLGDYVENLNKSQLKLGIWGGNVALDNLQIKENALSELDVPFKVKAGQIDKLTLKIPWKNLYGEAVVATLEGLYLLVVPGASIKYDAEKEEKSLQDIKQKELCRIEEALQKAAEKDKPKEAKKDTFLEKLATQVIKNVQVKITDIHIKYEDDITDPERPLSFGVTLREFSLLTTNEHWTPCILNEAEKIIYKLVKLDSLSAYWNVGCCMSYRGSREHILEQLKREILTSTNIPPDHQYIFQPISASAKLYMNPGAESELKTPKLDGNVEVQNIAIELTKPQYLSMIDFLESLDYMVRNAPYRKYKPCLPLHTNCRQWWKYAIDSVLEVHIRRYTQPWSWSNIKNHRQLLKSYKMAYKTKLTQAKVSEEIQKQIQDLEKSLDVFNIILVRQQAQVEVIHSGQKLRKKSAEAGEKRGWFSGFWGKKESKKRDEESSVPETIDDLMTPEEKDKLFTAIGYSENAYNLALPKQYVAHILTLKLVSTSIIIRENRNVPEILRVQIIGLGTQVSQRPGAQALKIEAKLEHWYVTGLRQQDIVPSLVASIGDTTSSLLKIEFETNPENSPADQTLIVQSQPVEVIYDAKTINAVVEFFQSNKGLDLEQITSATLMKLEEIKERTATGLTHIIETRKVLDLRINLKPSYLIIPQTGFHHEKSNLLILDFGTFQLNSKDQGAQKTANASLEEIIDKAYDKFDVEIRSVQLLFAKAEENWKKCRFQHPSTMHILQPMDIHVELAKAMVEKDVRMAKFKVSGGLPLMHVRISDQKIKDALCLINSIPLPQKSSTPSPERQVASIPVLSGGTKALLGTSLLLDGVESESDEEFFDAEDGDSQAARTVKASELKKAAEVPNEELVSLLLKFEIKEVVLELTKQQKEEETILVFNVTQLGTEATMRTFDLTAVSYLRKISLDYHDIKGSRKKPIHLISSSDRPGLDLLKVEYIKVDRNGPSFQTTFEKTEQTVKVAFSSLNLLLQTQALLSSLNYLTTVIPSDSQNTGVAKEVQAMPEKQKNSPLQKVMVPSRDSDVIGFRLFAKLNAFCVTVCDEKSNIAEIKIQGLDSSLSLQSKKQSLFARLENIIVTDVDPKTIHKKAVSIVGNEVFRFNLDLYPDATEGDSYTDMSTVDGVVALHVGCIQIVYLHKFLMSLLSFLNNFQVAKEALSAATAQAAEKAATSVKDLAQRSFRVSVDIDLKAPVIVIPQSSLSTNAVVVDLGLIRVHNRFSLVSGEDTANPPVIDKMEVQLTKLKLSRTAIQPGTSHPDIQLLHPINLEFFVSRNLAANWYHKVPVVEIKGRLDSMNVSLNQEDLNLLFRILAENLGEATEDLDKGKPRIQERGETKACREVSTPQDVHTTQGVPAARVEETRPVDIINVLLNFEIKEVVVTLMKKAERKGSPFHELKILHLGMEAKVKAHDMTAAAYLRNISMRCFHFPDSKGEPLRIVNTSDVSDGILLKLLFIKADSDGPDFKTIHDNTKQKLKVSFSSLDLVLHLEALLSLMDFLSSAIPSSDSSSSEKEPELKPLVGESRSLAIRAVPSSYEGDAFDLKITAELNAFNIFICDQKSNIAEIKIHGMDASISVKPKQTDVFARLKNIIVMNVDSLSIHKKAVSILGDEVFRFQMSLYPDATEGENYGDMSKVDGRLSLKVGCIQIVYVHKFFMSLLSFLNNFQAAKEALSTATVQAAERAASSVKDLAQKSFRLLMDIDLKAPVITIPQSSVSPNVVIADLGLIRVENKFSLVSVEQLALPPVADEMSIQLTQLKLARTVLQADSPQHDVEILKPVNMLLCIQRNLSAAWYTQIPGMEIKGELKPMQVALSQDDLTVLMKILLENLGEASSQPSPTQYAQEAARVKRDTRSGPDYLKEQELADPKPPGDQTVTLQFDFHFDSLSIILYNSDSSQEPRLSFHNDSFRLGELTLHLMASAGKMFKDGSMNVSLKLKTCTLDDLREGIERATSRMIDKKNDQDNNSSMIDISYSQDKNGSQVDAVLDKLYVCASVEFLMTVADFFIKAMPQSPENIAKEIQIPSRQTAAGRVKMEKDDSVRPNMTLKAMITDPEVVFVASLTKADAPALTASFQCNLSLSTSKLEQMMEASAAGSLERSFVELSGAERERPRHFREFTVCDIGTASAAFGTVKYSESAGGFYYVESGKLFSITRNRFIHWKTSGDTLELVEESLDLNLLNNAVRLKFQNYNILPGGVHVSETQNHVIILILTNQTVHRLILPHPSRMYRSELVTESQMQSIFTDIGKVDFRDPCNSQLIPSVPGLSPGSTTSAAWLSSDGEALFALPSASGGIFVLKLPPYDVPGIASVVELKQSSVMQRLLTGWMPTAIRGDHGPSDRALSLAVHCVEHDAFIFALCQDHKLRMWSYKDQMCLMVADMLEYVPVNKDLRLTAGTGHKLRLAYSPSMGLYLGIYMHAPKRGQFCVFQLVSTENNRYSLDHISSLFTSQETLVDFALTSTDIWALWHDAENQTIVKYINFEHNVAGQWNPVFMQPLPEEEIVIRDDQDPREMYLRSLFTPGHFINAALCKALQIFCRGTERNLDLSWNELKKEITLAVENELQGSVTEYEFSQDEFRTLQQEFWCKFYACVLQYQEALSHPLALHLNPVTNMVCLLKKGYLSFLVPSSLVDHLYLLPDEHLLTEDETTISDDADVARDVLCLIKCLRMIGESVTMDMAVLMETSCYNLQSPEKAAEHILEDLITIDVENVMEDICSKLQEIRNPVHAIGLLIREMDYETEVEMEKGFDPAQPLNVRMNLSQLYGSSTAGYIVCRGVYKIASTRFLICRDLLILQQLLTRLGDAVILGAGQLFQAQQDLLHRTAPLLLSYYLIKWASQCLATDVPVDTLESNLQHLSVLELTDSGALMANKLVSSPQTIMELFFQEVARKQIISHLFSQPKAPLSQTGLNWPEMITAVTGYLLQLLWPSNPGCLFLECLMGNCQYVQLQDYIQLLHPWCQVNVGSCRFMLGRCYLVTGEVQKALECFCQAASEVGKEEFLDRLIRSEDGEIVSTPKLQYYDKVLRLLDVVGLPELVIQLATSAITEAGDDWKSQATLRTCIFKHHLDLGHNSQAYEALTQIPDSSRQLDCLRQLVVVLCERSQLQDLVEFPYVNLHNEVVGIIESRARAVDLMTHNYYELLYAFHIYRHNYRKAGTVMFEYGMRLGREVRTLRGLEKQGNCYLAAINCLRLIRPEYAWIVQPASGAVSDRPGASPKRNHDGECTAAPTNRQIEILELEDLEKEYSLARIRLTLARHDPSVIAIAGSSSAKEMSALLVQAGLFDTAISLCQTFTLPLTPVFEGLAFKCIKLQFGGEAAQGEAWSWLATNQLSSVITTKESSATDEAWRLLSTYLERYKVQNNLYHHCVINKLLSHGVPLPNWLINSYKKVDAAELLRLYLNYDLLEEAVDLVSEYVDAVLGKGHQYFGIEFPLSATAPMVWLPYSSIDQLLQALGENSANSHNIILSQKILDKLEDYQQKVDKATRDLLYRRDL